MFQEQEVNWMARGRTECELMELYARAGEWEQARFFALEVLKVHESWAFPQLCRPPGQEVLWVAAYTPLPAEPGISALACEPEVVQCGMGSCTSLEDLLQSYGATNKKRMASRYLEYDKRYFPENYKLE